VAANRGASGIDGVLSSAAGFAFGLNRPSTLLVGDISFLHDINGLNLLRSGASFLHPIFHDLPINHPPSLLDRWEPLKAQCLHSTFPQVGTDSIYASLPCYVSCDYTKKASTAYLHVVCQDHLLKVPITNSMTVLSSEVSAITGAGV